MASNVFCSLLQVPLVKRGMCVGLFGGSFNPPHEGHALVAQMVLERLELDALWWMVAPANPFKNPDDPTPLAQRLYLPSGIVNNPRVHLTAFEQLYGFSHTLDTLMFLRKYFPGVRFVWIMGADNLPAFHRWKGWKTICMTFPVLVVARPGTDCSVFSCVMATVFHFARLGQAFASKLALMEPPVWIFIEEPVSDLSSTIIRLHSPFLLPAKA